MCFQGGLFGVGAGSLYGESGYDEMGLGQEQRYQSSSGDFSLQRNETHMRKRFPIPAYFARLVL